MLIGGEFLKNSNSSSVICALNEGSDFVCDSSNGNNINKVNSEATFDGCPEIWYSLFDSLDFQLRLIKAIRLIYNVRGHS